MPPSRLLAVAAAAVLATFARPPVPLAAQRVPFTFERFAQERGLSNATVTSIAQGRRGFLWLGTQDGLDMYDGTGFTVYRPVPGDSTSLSDAWVTAIAASPGGPIWIGTLHGGVLRRDARLTGGFRRYRHDAEKRESIASDDINTLLEDTRGVLWIGTPTGLDGLDTATNRARHFVPATTGDSARFSNDVISLADVADGPLWVGTRRGVFLLDRASGRLDALALPLVTREVRSLVLDAHGVMWIGTRDDLLGVDARSHRVVRHYVRPATGTDAPIADGVNALALGDNGRLWIGSDDGVVELNPSSGAFTRHTHDAADPRSLGGPIVRSLLVDRGGVLWVGLESYGLSKYAPSAVTFALLRHEDGNPRTLSDGYVRGITEDRAGNLWIGTQNGGLDRIEARTNRITVFRHRAHDPRSLPGDNVWAFLEDHTGTTWVGLHETGLGTFDPATGWFKRFALVPSDASINTLVEDRAGELLVGTEGRGLYVVAPDRRSVRVFGASLGDERVLENNDVQSILEDRAGRLWVGGTDGLTRIDRATGAIERYTGAPGQPGRLGSTFVTNIVQDSRGTIWVATKGGGLNRFDERSDTFTSLGPAQGLPHSFVYGVLEDAHHKLWLSTDDGIAMYDPSTGLVVRYGLEDGLQAREFNRRAHYRAKDGTMYFGGINGVNIFHPDALGAMPTPPAVAFVSLETNGAKRSVVQLSADSIVDLPSDENAFTITFAALDYTAPEKIRYAYKLEGVDHDWVFAGDRHQATYASVPPGNHLFRVIAASPAGQWNREGAAVTFVVRRPWWATWWARVLAAIALGGIILLITRIRLESARRRSAELERRVDEQTRSLTEAQARLRESLQREREAARELVDVTDAVPGAVFQLREALNGSRSVIFVSEGIYSLFPTGTLPMVAHGDPRRAAETLFLRIEPADRTTLERTLANSRTSLKTWNLELRWTPGDDGAARWVAIQAHTARHMDGSTVWTGVMTDATDARRAEAERVALESKMLHAQKAESLAVLAGGVAHDFNNVLVSVTVGAELLEYQIVDNPRAIETARRIRTAGFRAAELTQQMLAYAGKGRLTVEPVDLARIAEDMLSLVRATVPRTVDIDFESDAAPAVVEADATQLRQIVMNLVTNAGEAIGERAGRIRVRVGVEDRPASELALLHASPELPADGPFVVLEVEDDGCGMDPALFERIFDPFFTTKFTGRGLGLAALLGIVRGHRGGVRVSSEPGRGTRFSIYLPRAEGAAKSVTPIDTEAVMASDAQRVLVADDEETVREITQVLLERLGYEVMLVSDGAAALALAETRDFDVYLLDVTMPKLNGAATARALRDRGVSAPIVLMSGYAAEDLLTRGLTIDADAFLKKPFLASDLAAVLREVLGAGAGAGAG